MGPQEKGATCWCRMESKPGVQNVASAEQGEVSLRQACTWTQASSSKKIQRKYQYKGLKITACMRSWGKFWTTRYKETKKPNCHC